MRFIFTGKNMSVAEGLKEQVISKLSRIEKFLPEDAEAQVTFSTFKHLIKMEVSIPMHKRILRAEVSDADANSCMDEAVDILERQVKKYKTRLRDRRRRNVATTEEIHYINAENDVPDGTEEKIIRTKRFAFKPMEPQDAIMEMELLHHNFFVFHNASIDEISVVYKRKDGEYGLIEPQ